MAVVNKAFDGVYAIDRFSYFNGSLQICGWVYCDGFAIVTLTLLLTNGARHELRTFGAASPDLVPLFGPVASNNRFNEILSLNVPSALVASAKLEVSLSSPISRKLFGLFSEQTKNKIRTQEINRLGDPVGDKAHQLSADFLKLLAAKTDDDCRFLEIGSRARSGVVNRHFAPPGWEYSGFDILAGPNVDIVGDAHELSSFYPQEHFDAVMAISVIEHILMPWKLAIELNKVMKIGGIGFMFTHQCWPLHDQPWDFWRFSDEAWKALFNPATGFEIISAQMGEPAYIVAAKIHPATAFAETPAGFLASSVLFRKISETDLQWPVSVNKVLDTQYPDATTHFK